MTFITHVQLSIFYNRKICYEPLMTGTDNLIVCHAYDVMPNILNRIKISSTERSIIVAEIIHSIQVFLCNIKCKSSNIYDTPSVFLYYNSKSYWKSLRRTYLYIHTYAHYILNQWFCTWVTYWIEANNPNFTRKRLSPNINCSLIIIIYYIYFDQTLFRHNKFEKILDEFFKPNTTSLNSPPIMYKLWHFYIYASLKSFCVQT